MSKLPHDIKRGLTKTLDKNSHAQEIQLKAISDPKDFIDKYIAFNIETKKQMLKVAEETFLEQIKENVDTDTASKLADETARRIIANRDAICDIKFPQTAVNLAYKLLKDGAQARELIEKINGKKDE